MFSPIFETAPPIVLLGALSSTEEDCACPAPPIVEPHTFEPAALYVQSTDLLTLPLNKDWTLVCNTLAGGAPAVLNAAARSKLAAFEAPHQLASDLDRKLAEARLIAPIGVQYTAPAGQPTTLTAWLHITNACNLDCPYCYVRKSAAKMTFEIGAKAIDSLIATAQQHGFTTLKLKYAGGEAVLHYRMIQRLHAYAAAQADLHGLALQAVVLSNGTVMPVAFADWLAESGVRLMLSVDGTGDIHDSQRPLKKGGGGAFTAIERNLTERLLPRGIRPDICITITGRTAHNAHTAVAWALGHDLPFSLNFYRENEQSARHHELRFEEQQIIAGVLKTYDMIEQRLPLRPFLNGLLDRVQAQAHGHTCGVGQSYVVITHEGQVAQCQMNLQSAQPFDATSDLIRLVSTGAIHNISVDEKEGCRSCIWRYRCAGGCPIVTLRATGRTDIKSPNCAIYQALMPAALRLEGLRLLKWQAFLAA